MNMSVDLKIQEVAGRIRELREIIGLSVDEIAKMLNIGRSTAYVLVKEGHFKAVRIGSAIRISRQSFDEWLDRQEF